MPLESACHSCFLCTLFAPSRNCRLDPSKCCVQVRCCSWTNVFGKLWLGWQQATRSISRPGRGAQRAPGYSRSRLCGDVSHRIHPHDKAHAVADVSRTASTGQMCTFQRCRSANYPPASDMSCFGRRYEPGTAIMLLHLPGLFHPLLVTGTARRHVL